MPVLLLGRPELDGRSLFDHTCLAYGSNIRTIHYLDNGPTLLTGGAANIKLGQHLVVSKDTPLCNVWLTLLNGIGCKLSATATARGGEGTASVELTQLPFGACSRLHVKHRLPSALYATRYRSHSSPTHPHP